MIFQSPYPPIVIPETPLTAFVLRHADRLVDKPALIDGANGQLLTYGQIADGVRRAAAGLAERGFQKGDVLALIAPNSLDYAVAFHAIASIGGIAAPLNPSFTVPEAAVLLRETGACGLFTTPELFGATKEAALNTDVREIFVFGDTLGATPFATLLESGGRRPC
jgi:acyl-CoA synthetase (AMP-forming)/AMP-acid ligase II